MRLHTILSVSALAIAVGTCFARADEVLKVRLMMHAVGVQTQDVADVEGHTMSVIRYSGLASFADGTVGTAGLTATTDYIKGNGTYSNYTTFTHKDGSALTFKVVNGPAKLEGTTTTFPEAPLTITRGTGRFEGAKGDGTQTGARLTPLAQGAELFVDVVLNVKK
jgi:hypothetical protein